MKTKRRFLTLFVLTCVQFATFAQIDTIDYFGQEPPGDIPVKFAPGIISLTGQAEVNPFFSPDGKEFYYAIMDDINWSSITTMVSKFVDNAWTTPVDANISVHEYDWSCIISPDGNTMYHSSAGSDWQYDIYTRERTEDGWSEAVSISDEINNHGSNLVTSISAGGSIYFRSTRDGGNLDIYFAESNNGVYDQVVKMGTNINTNANESHPTVAQDNSYLIFYRGVESSAADIYVSFRNDDNTWSESLSMGLSIHSGQPGASSITPDGKYLLYQGVDKDLYWLSLEHKIDSLKNLTITSIPDNRFEGHDLLIYPNPATQTVRIKTINSLLLCANYQIVDMGGRTLLAGKVESEQIDVSALNRGTYFIILKGSDKIIHKKIIIE